MKGLPEYKKIDKAKFNFRVPDGHGGWCYPDKADPDLRVEFYDAEGVLRRTVRGSDLNEWIYSYDFDPVEGPDGGDFVLIESINLTDFALGVAEAWVYAKVSSSAVVPYPTVLAAFEVVE